MVHADGQFYNNTLMQLILRDIDRWRQIVLSCVNSVCYTYNHLVSPPIFGKTQRKREKKFRHSQYCWLIVHPSSHRKNLIPINMFLCRIIFGAKFSLLLQFNGSMPKIITTETYLLMIVYIILNVIRDEWVKQSLRSSLRRL